MLNGEGENKYNPCGGEPKRAVSNGIGSDVDTGNAEICSITANSDKSCVHQILVDPARGHCYRGSIKPCESRGERPRHTAQ